MWVIVEFFGVVSVGVLDDYFVGVVFFVGNCVFECGVF